MPMNISLTPHLEEMIREKIASGSYNSASEVGAGQDVNRTLLKDENAEQMGRNPSHQTHKFPATPSIFSTSTRLIRMIK